MNKILRINMKTKEIVYESPKDEYLKTGGRGLIAKIMLNEVNPTCDPLGRENKLIIANGMLTGTNVSSASRISIGAKSPLTGGIKESNGGGITAMWLAQLGLKALVVEDVPEGDNWYYIKIDKNGCTLEPADEYAGMGTFEYCEKMIEKYPDCAVTCIGPAGERLYHSAGIATMDKEKKPNRYSGRGGLGAVMGSKKIKGIVAAEKGSVTIKNKEKFSESFKEYTKIVMDAPSSANYRTLGTASTVRVTNDLTGLPTRNFRGEKFEHADKISGESLYEFIKERGGEGKTTHACMPGCVIQCSNVVPDKDGKTIVSPLEYETIGLMGSNLGIGDFDVIARLNAMCNDFGIDTIEVGAAMGVAMEAGEGQFGDASSAFKMMDEIINGTIFGKVLACGATTTGKVLGVSHVPAVNGQAMPAYDPRAIKGMGATFATSPMGADHTYGPVIKTDKGWAEASKGSQSFMAILDSLGFCMFTRAAIANEKQLLVDLVNGFTGYDLDLDWLEKVSTETIKDELKFNELAGFTKENYRMPESFKNTKIKSTGDVFDLTEEELDELRR
ncbi:MAG: Aldehyde ferredoxin oxidoreductase [Sedimentibacter sp.]|jgi:aldehyde:ferredoxin oxidoreductase|nr:Aldehyde ferredoxin oxidoreductase [Sedimentibacter sp.]